MDKAALPFHVLVDRSRDTLRAYGVWQRLDLGRNVGWNIAKPALFLIAPDRSISRSFVAARQDEFPGHDEILSWIDVGAKS